MSYRRMAYWPTGPLLTLYRPDTSFTVLFGALVCAHINMHGSLLERVLTNAPVSATRRAGEVAELLAQPSHIIA